MAETRASQVTLALAGGGAHKPGGGQATWSRDAGRWSVLAEGRPASLDGGQLPTKFRFLAPSPVLVVCVPSVAGASAGALGHPGPAAPLRLGVLQPAGCPVCHAAPAGFPGSGTQLDEATAPSSRTCHCCLFVFLSLLFGISLCSLRQAKRIRK